MREKYIEKKLKKNLISQKTNVLLWRYYHRLKLLIKYKQNELQN